MGGGALSNPDSSHHRAAGLRHFTEYCEERRIVECGSRVFESDPSSFWVLTGGVDLRCPFKRRFKCRIGHSPVTAM